MRAIAAAMVVLSLSASSADSQSVYSECGSPPDRWPDNPDSALVQVAFQISRAADRIQQVWPGFWQPEEHVLLHVPGGPAVFAGTAQVPARPAAQTETSQTFFFPGGLNQFWEESGFSKPSSRTLDLDAELLPLPAYPAAAEFTMALVFHEHFHRFQKREFDSWPYDSAVAQDRKILGSTAWASYASDPILVMLQAEQRLLRGALESEHPDTTRDLVRKYLAVRHLRIAGDAKIEWNEGELERMEGVAEWVGWAAAAVVLRCDPGVVARHISGYRLASFSKGRERFYGTGAAQAELLERFGVAWKERVQSGDYMHLILAGAVDFDPAQAGDLVNEVLGGSGS